MTERLLITTTNRVSILDGKREHVIIGKHRRGYTAFHGFTWNENEIFISESGGPEDNIFHVLDGDLNRLGRLPIAGIRNTHQMYWWSGKLYISGAGQDRIAIWDGETCRMTSWREPEEPPLHPNSIWCDGGRFYVVEHRHREQPKRIRILDLEFKPIGCIELDTDRSRLPGLHNVYIEGTILYTCTPESLILYDLSTNKFTRVFLWTDKRYEYFVKGFARPPGRFFVGLSRRVARDKRKEGDSMVVVLDDDLNILDRIRLKDAGGLADIRAIDGPDLAHNRIECPYR